MVVNPSGARRLMIDTAGRPRRVHVERYLLLAAQRLAHANQLLADRASQALLGMKCFPTNADERAAGSVLDISWSAFAFVQGLKGAGLKLSHFQLLDRRSARLE